MFASNVRRFFFVCDKVIIRNLRGKNRVLANPGLDNRLNAFQKDGIKIQDGDVEEFMEQSESSFYEVGEAYNDHLNETLIGKYELRHHIVKERYFKENMPNLLTWSEKEQIRHLASTQPNDWTPERIAESFPVTEQVVKKLLKYPWKPATEERIARHDASAMRNWKELKEGTLDIPDKLREHFLKFSDRIIPPLNRKSVKVDLSQEKIGEFEQIVRRCANINENDSKDNDIHSNETISSIKKPKEKVDHTKVTLNELASKIKERLDHGQNVDLPDRIILDTVETESVLSEKGNVPKTEIDVVAETKQEKNMMEYKEEDNKLFTGMNYPEKIRIPRKAYKKGATYKVNDCFYDHDGTFLYRVIGMDENVNHQQK